MLYILDEPTTGLHFDDIAKLLAACRKLIQAGHSLLVIEHNLDVIKTADWIIDLGPEGGARGGKIVAKGTPEQVAAARGSATGEYLARVLRGEPLVPLSDVSFAEAAGRVRAVAVPIDPDAVTPGATNGNGASARGRRTRGGVPAAR